MRSVTPFNAGWTFHEGFDEALIAAARAGAAVSLPHSAVELPLNYFDEAAYQRRFTYQASLPGGRISRAARWRWSSTAPWPMRWSG